MTAPRLRIGVDVGGTFTDLVAMLEPPDGPAEVRTLKLPSTPEDPARAVLEGVERLVGQMGSGAPDESDGGAAGPRGPDVVHGSTVATNALLERTGARTALVTTAGFRDVLAVARQDRPSLYDLFEDRPTPLVPTDLCFELEERVTPDGTALRRLEEGQVERLAGELAERGVEAVAVCLLFSFARPEHEERTAEVLREAGFHVSASSEVLPEFREYERASTTAMNAYLAPVVDRYLERLDRELPVRRFRVMQSNGGTVAAGTARRRAVGMVLSGPAGGVVGGLHVAREAGVEDLLTLDMGGTSTDVSLARGEPRVTTEATIGGLPVAVPVLDLHTVGSGGGSVARVDPGGALRVGPESAGADPGPACYGRGGRRATVTDAHLVLGRLAPELFLGGEMALDPGAAREALEALGREAGLDGDGVDPARAAALGVVRVANARMERALRVISVERGHDPADFVLVSFGGAGGLHACELARALGVRRVLLPPGASTLSAHGMLAADVLRERSRTVMRTVGPGDAADAAGASDGAGGSDDAGELDAGGVADLAGAFAPLVEAVRSDLRDEGFPDGESRIHREVEMRYRGQSYELRVPFGEGLVERFHRRHRERYGHAEPGAPVEAVTIRVRGVGTVESPPLPAGEPGPPDPSSALLDHRPVVMEREDGGADLREVPFYRGAALRPGHRIEGPAVVAREDTTAWIGPADRGRVDPRGNLVVEVGR